MSVASSNPFALLSEDGSPAAPAAKPAPQKADAPKPREVPGAPKRQANRKGPAAPREGSFAADGNAARDEPRRAPRGDARGRGRGRGGRARGGGHGRQFDRHSATAHTDSAKTVEQGWGGADAKRELQAEAEGKADAKAEGAAPSTPAEPAAEEPAPAEPEEKTLTLDEYLASLAEKKAAISANKKEARQVDAAPEAAKKVTKATEAELSYFAAVNKEKAHKAKKDKSHEQIDTAFSFAPPSAGRGRPRDGAGPSGRGRGAPRGRGAGNGRGRGGRAAQGSRQPDVNLGDAKAFPSLGA